jgi:hypothetical protein
MAITLGVDYSYNPPTPAELAKWGAKFACRYLVGRAPKKLTADEVSALQKVGIALVSNYESTEGFMLDGGFDKGVSVAKAAWATHKAVGGPDHRPIYFSADTDPGGWTAAQWISFDRFLDGAASVLGGKQGVGVYGGTLALQAALAGGSCGWFWQALGWRNGTWLSWVHIQQYDNGNLLGSGEVDYDRAMAADYGQWGIDQEEGDVSYEDWTQKGKDLFWADFKRKMTGQASDSPVFGARFDAGALTITELLGKYGPNGLERSALAQGIAQAVAAKGAPVTLTLADATPEQIDGLGKAIAAHLVVMGQSFEGTVELHPAAPA